MNFPNARKTTSLAPLVLAAAVALAAGCSTDSGSKKAGSADPTQESEYPSATEARNNPDRIVCRRHESTGARVSEKICMTARQWHRASDDTARTLDRAQRATGSIEGN